MTWIDLINGEINILVDNQEKLKKQLDKIRGDDTTETFDKKVALMVEIKSIDMTICRIHDLLGKRGLVDE